MLGPGERTDGTGWDRAGPSGTASRRRNEKKGPRAIRGAVGLVLGWERGSESSSLPRYHARKVRPTRHPMGPMRARWACNGRVQMEGGGGVARLSLRV